LNQGINPALYGSGGTSNQHHMVDIIEPLDFEEYMTAQASAMVRQTMLRNNITD
jgi:hypothetical protein